MNIYRLKAIIITFFCCLLLSQTVVFAQNAKKISIKKEKVSLKEALTEIEKQTKMSVAYNESQLGADKTISLNVVDATIEKALDQILKGTGFAYKIQGDHIMIVQEPKQEKGKSKKITGQVLDDQNMPLIGVNIVVKGKTGVGAITNIDGNFTLEVNQGDAIEVSYIGYAPQTAKSYG